MKVNVYSGYYEKYITPKKLGKEYNLDYTDELKYVVFDTEDEWNNDKNSEEAVVWDKDIMDDVIKYSSNPWAFEDEEPEEDENGDISYGNMFIFSDMTSIMAESRQFNKNILKENDNYDGKYYVDIEDEDEDALYSSDIEFDNKNKAVSWAYDELEKNKDNDDVYQASIYQMFINDDGDLDHELIEVIHKDDLDESRQISRKRNLIYENTNIPIGKRTDTFEYKGYGKKYKIYLCLEEYYYGGIAVLAKTSRGEPFADISINLQGVPLEDNEIFINDYISDDLCDKLVSLGILKETDETQEYNFGIYRKYIVNFDKFNR